MAEGGDISDSEFDSDSASDDHSDSDSASEDNSDSDSASEDRSDSSEDSRDLRGPTSSVYIIMEEPHRQAKTYRCKVGKSSNVDKRCQQLKTGNSRELRVVKKFQVYNAVEAEKAAHKMAERYRYKRLRGEWFQVNRNKFEDFKADIERAVRGF